MCTPCVHSVKHTRAGTTGFEDLPVRPYVEAVREVVGVYRTGLAVAQADPGDRESSYVMKTCVLKSQ